MSVDSKVPEIRFKGFSGEWKNKKIGRILAEIKRPIELMDNASYQLVTVKRRNEGVVPRVVLKGKNILVKNYFSVKAGDYLISKRQVVHGANGIVPDNLDGAVVSNEYLVVTDSDDITARYWTVISIRPEMHKLFFVSSYGVDIEKLVFDVTDWKNRTIVIPQVTEQKNITDYFQKLDALINQHQQKHDKLSSIKKAMLEKMFPKQGDSIPEIRFKGFSGEWKKLTLGDLGSVAMNKRIFKHQTTIIGEIPFFKIGTFGKQADAFISKTLFDEYKAKYPYPVAGDLLLSASGSIGRVVEYKGEEQYFQDSNIVWLKHDGKIDNAFLKVFYSMVKWSGLEGSTIQRLYNKNILDTEISTPERHEQTAIGNYFQKLDALINQHQQQITKLNNIKQACLCKMFV
ncbi:restriction endonuclease subunit S [Yersinia enterocolitica]|uniref:restriction endonuclease subunit S n=1 Tax=Yersinia enterocolitica TaxID=630 RepID=UPI002AC610DE|nr:restriction endonuclease subunit S [Yersinia enterocolitica]HEN3347392.1 restriction endonuclease subunit S [Yersinia enterocolitica]